MAGKPQLSLAPRLVSRPAARLRRGALASRRWSLLGGDPDRCANPSLLGSGGDRIGSRRVDVGSREGSRPPRLGRTALAGSRKPLGARFAFEAVLGVGDLAAAITTVEIGGVDTSVGSGLSDHAPLIVDLDEPAAALQDSVRHESSRHHLSDRGPVSNPVKGKTVMGKPAAVTTLQACSESKSCLRSAGGSMLLRASYREHPVGRTRRMILRHPWPSVRARRDSFDHLPFVPKSSGAHRSGAGDGRAPDMERPPETPVTWRPRRFETPLAGPYVASLNRHG